MDVSPFLNVWTEQDVAYTRRDLLLYAAGINAQSLQFAWEEDDKFAAFPTFPIVLGFKGDRQGVVPFPSPAMANAPESPPLEGIKFVLDGERSIEQINPLPIGIPGDETDAPVTLKLRQRIIGVHKRGSGASVETEALIVDAKDGKIYTRMVSGGFFVGAEGFKDAGVTNSEKVSVPGRAPDAVDEIPVSVNQAKLYRLSGDYNPMHVDPNTAMAAGFKEPILHGLCSLGIATNALLERYAGGDPGQFRQVKLRFASPVLPGQTLQVESWKEADKIIFQVKVKETGKVCVNNAYVKLGQPSAKL